MAPFHEITEDNVVDYLIFRQHLHRDEPARAETLAWGVSNIVIRIHRDAESDFVVKQSRAQLRTKAEWLSNLDRIWREVEVMRELRNLLPGDTIPRVLFEDRDNYLFAMDAIDANHRVWKGDLLEGRCEPDIAKHLGEYLATIHGQTFLSTDYQIRWGDQEVFDQLRIDPFYRYLVQSHSELQEWIAALIDEMGRQRLCLVLADFSPKNILITLDGIHLVDFETAHFGDPAFDLGFFLSHLLLKAIHHRKEGSGCLQLADLFWRKYITILATKQDNNLPQTALMSEPELDCRTIKHLAACMLARVDGKSPVDYIKTPDIQKDVRRFARSLIVEPPASVCDAFMRLAEMRQLN